MSPKLRPQDLEDQKPVETITGRNRTKADVLFYRLADRAVAVKTYAPRPWWIRHTLGRWLIRREAAAFAAASGIAGVPAFLGRLDPFTLASEWVPAQPLASRRGERLEAALFDDLATILDQFHRRGIAVADLHHRDVLVAADGSVYLVDLAMAFVLGPRPGRLRRALHRRLVAQDRVALARMRARSTGGDVAAAVAAVGPEAAAWHARGRRLKSLLDRLRGKTRRGRGETIEQRKEASTP